MTPQEMFERVRAFPIENGEITGMKWFDGVKIPEPNAAKLNIYNPGGYVEVNMALHPTEQSNILVAIALPDESFWNGNLLGTGNGGAAGEISSGSIISGVSRGYVTVTTNMGTSPEPYDCIGNWRFWVSIDPLDDGRRKGTDPVGLRKSPGTQLLYWRLHRWTAGPF